MSLHRTKDQRRRETAAMHKCPDCGNVAGLGKHRCGRCETIRQEEAAEQRRRAWIDEQMEKRQ